MGRDRTDRRAGRPTEPLLNRQKIAAMALEIITTEGAGNLTMKRLADRLDVSVSALYNHIKNKAELVLFVQDAVMAQVDTTAMEELAHSGNASDLREALRSWSISSREVFSRYSELVPLIATMPVSGAPATRRVYEAVSAGLLAAGVPKDQVIRTIIAFESFVFGSAMDVNAPASIFGSAPAEEDAPVFQDAVHAFTGSIPADTGNGTNPYADDPFYWGLDSLIDSAIAKLG